MAQIEHTKGPFEGGLMICAARGQIVAHVQTRERLFPGYSNPKGAPENEVEGNIRLITRFNEVPHTCTDQACPGMENLRKLEALEAILARINGEWDHPALVKFGPLSTSALDDVYDIAKAEGSRRDDVDRNR